MGVKDPTVFCGGSTRVWINLHAPLDWRALLDGNLDWPGGKPLTGVQGRGRVIRGCPLLVNAKWVWIRNSISHFVRNGRIITRSGRFLQKNCFVCNKGKNYSVLGHFKRSHLFLWILTTSCSWYKQSYRPFLSTPFQWNVFIPQIVKVLWCSAFVVAADISTIHWIISSWNKSSISLWLIHNGAKVIPEFKTRTVPRDFLSLLVDKSNYYFAPGLPWDADQDQVKLRYIYQVSFRGAFCWCRRKPHQYERQRRKFPNWSFLRLLISSNNVLPPVLSFRDVCRRAVTLSCPDGC